MQEFKFTNKQLNDMRESLSRIQRQVKLIKEGKTKTRSGEDRLDIITQCARSIDTVICDEGNSYSINNLPYTIPVSDVMSLLDVANLHGTMSVVSHPKGTNEHETHGIFTEVYVDQWSVGERFEGFIYGKFAEAKYLKVPFSI